MRCVIFARDGFVADHRPAGGADHFHIKVVALIKTHGMRHDDGRRAGDRDEADLEVTLFWRAPALRHGLPRACERKEAIQRGE